MSLVNRSEYQGNIMDTKHRERNGARRVMIVDDDCAVRLSLRQIFFRAGRFVVASEHARGDDAIHKLTDMPTDQQPDLVLLDITMPRMDGIECCSELRARSPGLIIAMFTGRSVRECFDPTRLAGADAFIVKDVSMDQLITNLYKLRRCDTRCLCVGPPTGSGIRAGGGAGNMLSPENEAVIQLISTGFCIKQIADDLCIHEQTVKWHLGEIRRKLHALSNPDAVRIWLGY